MDDEERDFIMDCETGGQIVLEEMHGVVYLTVGSAYDRGSEAITEREARRLIHALSERFPQRPEEKAGFPPALEPSPLLTALAQMEAQSELRGPPAPTEGRMRAEVEAE